MRLPVTGSGTSAWFLIDDEDFSLLPRTLRLRKGHVEGQVYRGSERKSGRTVQISRLIMGVDGDPSVEVDHINRDGLDNRRVNLRVVPRGANSQNMSAHRDSVSRFRGVSWDKHRGKWKATAYHDGSLHHVGYFDDEDAAGKAAQEYRLANMQYAID